MEAADNKEFFESQWRQAFDGASVTPPPMVWERVEARLATQKEAKYKKAIFYYRWAAAAMTTVAVGLGAVLLINSRFVSSEAAVAAVAPVHEKAEVSTADPFHTQPRLPESSLAAALPELLDEPLKPLSDNSKVALIAQAAGSNEQIAALGGVPAGTVSGEDESAVNDFSTPILTVSAIHQSAALASNIGKVAVNRLYGVARPVPAKRRLVENQPLIAGLGLGSGTFDPNYGYRSGGSGLFNASSADEGLALTGNDYSDPRFEAFNSAAGLRAGASSSPRENNTQGGSFSVGGSIGKRIFRRLLVHTGINYGRYNSNGSTSLVLNDETNSKRYALNQASFNSGSVQDVLSSSQYTYESEAANVTNTYEFISVPVKLGVILLDRRTGIVLNTGISNEFLLGNLIKSKDSGFEDVKTKSGEGSPYRNVYLNGTLGLEVNYAINSHYKVVVEPYYRQAFTSLTKNTEGYSSAPRLWGVQAGVRYELR